MSPVLFWSPVLYFFSNNWFLHLTLLKAASYLSHLMTKPTKWPVHPAKTRISLGIRPVWSEPLLSAWRKLGSLATHWVQSRDSDLTGQMPRLIWVFAGRIFILVGFVMRRLILTYLHVFIFECCSDSFILKNQSSTVMILRFWTNRPGQTVQTQIRLLLEEQSDQGLHCCNSSCIFWHYSKVKPSCLTFRVITANFQVFEILGILR